MADNISVNGKTIATDSVSIGGSTVHVQRTKLGFGADGTYTADVNPSNPLPVADDAKATGGCTPHHKVSAGSGDATNVKSAAGTLYGMTLFTIDQTPIYVKFYDSASAPTAGSGTPVLVVGQPAIASALGTSRELSWPKGIEFASGIGYTIVTGLADNDSTGVSAAEVILGLQYE